MKMKVCMLGAFAVGKTSLVQRFVHSIFSEKYKTTLGVKIDKKTLSVDSRQMELILWDLAGEDEFMKVRSSYLRGSNGAIFVADGTRPETIEIVSQLNQKVIREVGEIPSVLMLNKSDLKASWQLEDGQLQELKDSGWIVIETSALENNNVEFAFHKLAEEMLQLARSGMK